MLNKNVMSRLTEAVSRIEYDLIAIHEDISEMFDTLESLDLSYDDDSYSEPSLDVVPHVLVSGVYKGKIALQWLCGNFAHNDITIPRESIKEAYNYYDVPHNQQIPYLF